jgi:hypothetical protein
MGQWDNSTNQMHRPTGYSGGYDRSLENQRIPPRRDFENRQSSPPRDRNQYPRKRDRSMSPERRHNRGDRSPSPDSIYISHHSNQ